MTEAESEFKEWLERKLSEPIPLAKPKRRNAEVFDLNPWRHRRWTAEPVSHTSAVAVEPTDADRMEELRREVAAAARRERMRCDPLGIGLYETENIDDVVRRQDRTR